MNTSSGQPESFQIPIEAAEFYESAFVPAFFAQWAPILCATAGITPGQRVLDVGCGTGIVARTAADLVAPDGRVVGVDLNEAMLTVARRVRADIEFHRANADALPFADETFDGALSQMALMFFPDRLRALQEMARVVASGATVAVLVPAALDAQPAFSAFVDVAARHAGREAMSLLSTYFACGNLAQLTGLVESAGLHITTALTRHGTYRAPSVETFVTTEVESTPLLERISGDTYRSIRADAQTALAPFITPEGHVEAPFECNIVAACRP